jgi:hypothetical protein
VQPKGGVGMHIIESLRMQLVAGLCNSLAVLDRKILGLLSESQETCTLMKAKRRKI